MAHTAPDWSWGGKVSTVFSVQDMAELAARLGSIDVFDRRGSIIFMDDFGDTLTGWLTDTTGSGGSVYGTCYPTMRGGLAVNMVPGQAVDNYAKIARVLPYPVESGIGLEFALLPTSGLGDVDIRLYFYTGSLEYYFGFRYAHETGKLFVRHSDGSYYEVGEPGILREVYNHFSMLKVVLDLTEKSYVRFIVNDTTYDCSDYDAAQSANTTRRCMNVELIAWNNTTGIIQVILDDVIITQNEDV